MKKKIKITFIQVVPTANTAAALERDQFYKLLQKSIYSKVPSCCPFVSTNMPYGNVLNCHTTQSQFHDWNLEVFKGSYLTFRKKK